MDPELAMAPDFFSPDGPVLLSLPDFLGDPARTGRARLPAWQLSCVLRPRAESWHQLAGQVARLVEQLAWSLVEPECPAPLTAAPVPEDGPAPDNVVEESATPKRKGLCRRQRQRAAAQRAAAAALEQQGNATGDTAAEAEDLRPQDEGPEAPGGVSSSSLQPAENKEEELPHQGSSKPSCDDESDEERVSVAASAAALGRENPQEAEVVRPHCARSLWSRGHRMAGEGPMWSAATGLMWSAAGTERVYPATEEVHHLTSSPVLSQASRSDLGSHAENHALNLCDVHTASCSSLGSCAGHGWGLAPSNHRGYEEGSKASGEQSPARSSKESVDHGALNLCEINTASWSSTGSRGGGWFAANARGTAVRRSVADILSDLTLFSCGMHCSQGSETGAVPSEGSRPLTAEALATWALIQAQAEQAKGCGMDMGGYGYGGNGLAGLPIPMGPMTGGLGPMSSGLGPMTGGLGPMTGGLGPMAGGLGSMPCGLGPMPGGLGSMPGGLGPMASGLGPVTGGLGPMTGGLGPMPGGLGPMAGGLGSMAGGLGGGLGPISGGLGPITGGLCGVSNGLGPMVAPISGTLPGAIGGYPQGVVPAGVGTFPGSASVSVDLAEGHGIHHHHHHHHLHQHQLYQHHHHHHQSMTCLRQPSEGASSGPFQSTGLPSLSWLEDLVGSEELREHRSSNLRWRLWGMASLRQATSSNSSSCGSLVGAGRLPTLAENDPSEWPLVKSTAVSKLAGVLGVHDLQTLMRTSELDMLWLRETRWENHCSQAARRFADLATSQRVWRQGVQRVLKFWQHRRSCVKCNQTRKWPWVAKVPSPRTPGTDSSTNTPAVGPSQSPEIGPAVAQPLPPMVQVGPMPSPTAPPLDPEGHVLVAVPVSRLEAVAKLLTKPS